MTDREFLSGKWVLAVLVALCASIEGLFQLGTVLGLSPAPRAVFYEYGAFWAGLLDNWQPAYFGQRLMMFFTYGFLHGGLAHLVINMIALWSLGIAVLEWMGGKRFLFLYLGSLIGGGAGYALLANAPFPMVGASGAISGLAGGLLVTFALERYQRGEPLRPIWGALAGLFAMNLILWWVLDGRLAWQTHLGGFVAGAVLMPFLRR